MGNRTDIDLIRQVFYLTRKKGHAQTYSTVKTVILNWAPEAHAYNPSYSRGRDEENRSLKPARQKGLQTLSWKILHKNRSGGVAQGEGPEFKSQYCKKKKSNSEKIYDC
jgi:hypothetical protein